MLGQGWQFESLRPFTEGDDLSRVDWKATARRAELIVSNYEVEREQNVTGGHRRGPRHGRRVRGHQPPGLPGQRHADARLRRAAPARLVQPGGLQRPHRELPAAGAPRPEHRARRAGALRAGAAPGRVRLRLGLPLHGPEEPQAQPDLPDDRRHRPRRQRHHHRLHGALRPPPPAAGRHAGRPSGALRPPGQPLAASPTPT